MSLKIAVTGSTGLIGREVVNFFRKQGFTVTPFVRKGVKWDSPEPIINWDIPSKNVDLHNLEGHDVVIHLAGASIAGKKWTNEYKEEILKSRTEGTSVIADAIARLKNPPKVFLAASAIGYYGPHKPDAVVDEEANAGEDYLARVCVEWEKAVSPAVQAGVRVVNMRIGTVIGKNGGALSKMLPIFQLGIGGVLGNGKQMMSWVALSDLPYMMQHCIENKNINGPVNFVSPNPVSNKEFTKKLGKMIYRPTFFPVPSFGLRMLYGEMADSLLLSGARIQPKILEETKYDFHCSYIETALEASLFKN